MQKFWKASSFFDKRFAQDEKSLEKITLYEIIKEIKVDDFFSNVTLSELKDQVEQLFEQETLRPDLINLQLVQELSWGNRDSDDYPKYYLVGARLESDSEWKTRLDKNANEVSSENFETDVVDRSVLTSTLKKEVSTRQNMKDLEDLLKIFHQHSTDQFDNHGFIKELGSALSKKDKDKP